jgi:hypothetical protein
LHCVPLATLPFVAGSGAAPNSVPADKFPLVAKSEATLMRANVQVDRIVNLPSCSPSQPESSTSEGDGWIRSAQKGEKVRASTSSMDVVGEHERRFPGAGG